MKKSDGSWTYFGADAAYHLQKAERPTISSTSGAPTMPGR
jgi:arginyl-tRNA synthetase